MTLLRPRNMLAIFDSKSADAVYWHSSSAQPVRTPSVHDSYGHEQPDTINAVDLHLYQSTVYGSIASPCAESHSVRRLVFSQIRCVSENTDVIWDNAPVHRGEAVREWLSKPGVNLRLVNLPGYSPDCNAEEDIWGWAREDATGNLCLGTKALVQQRAGKFLHGLSTKKLSTRKDEVKRRCRTVLQSMAEGFLRESQPIPNVS